MNSVSKGPILYLLLEPVEQQGLCQPQIHSAVPTSISVWVKNKGIAFRAYKTKSKSSNLCHSEPSQIKILSLKLCPGLAPARLPIQFCCHRTVHSNKQPIIDIYANGTNCNVVCASKPINSIFSLNLPSQTLWKRHLSSKQITFKPRQYVQREIFHTVR